MKTATAIVTILFSAALLPGCDLLKKKAQQEAPAPAPVVTEVQPTPPPPPPPPPPVEEKGPETLVSKEDIEKAAAVYNVLNDEDLTKKAKEEKFKALLAQYEWDAEKYTQLIFDIGRDPASAKIYGGLQARKEK